MGFKYTVGMRISDFCRYFIPMNFNVCHTMLVLCVGVLRLLPKHVLYLCVLLLVTNTVLKQVGTPSLCNLNMIIAV